MTPLENRLILHHFMCREFGFTDLSAMLARLQGISSGFTASGESKYARELRLNPEKSRVHPNRFAEYDREIVALSHQLRMTDEHGRGWKPHQYLALLFCEHYLHRYFENADFLCEELNQMRKQRRLTASMSMYQLEQLQTVAVQSATGSGKTLVMHANILQYRRIARDAGKPPNNVILVTPNEQMSLQHERDLHASNLPARLFSSEAEASLLATVEIIDLNKLAKKKGIKRVAVGDFGNNNLVLVDEGHLGSTGKKWRRRRTELARSGFTFEYSATFNQIANKNDQLRDTYGKCLIFDYPYRMFHADGYGKDYLISNLPKGAEDENSDLYLLGCLLSFYWQCRIWREHHTKWTDFNITKPLWVFLGKTVIATSRSKATLNTKSNVLRILNFLGWVLAHDNDVRNMLTYLVSGESGLMDDEDNDFFANKFDDLKNEEVDALYDDVRETLFHGAGLLHIVYLTQGEGELHLRTADNSPFGVVNVGDSAGLYRLLEKNANPDFALERDTGFVQHLFADVDREDSTVNIVIGARRFIAGWNSWRVTTMGLMHVGVGEGPEIIQMFGRGVRLKGWGMSLKRHREIDVEVPLNSYLLKELETLRIFGLRADYMKTFRDLLHLDGMSVELATFDIPVTWNFVNKDLKYFRVKLGLSYERSEERPALPCPNNSGTPIVEMDLYSQLQVVDSNESGNQITPKSSVKLQAQHTALFNVARIYDKLLTRKRRMGWHNLAIDLATVETLLNQCDWYSLYLPPERLEATSFEEIRKLENIALDLITAYIAQYWQRQCTLWEYKRIEVMKLEETDPNNIDKYRLSVEATNSQIIEYIRDLKSNLQEGNVTQLKLGIIMADSHAYKPLVYSTGNGKVKVQPAPINDGESKVVKQLNRLVEDKDPLILNRELFLIRNQTRGRGVSFFVEHLYYPDFIIWLLDGTDQHIILIFLDPKGLVRYGPKERKRVQLHSKIAEIEKRIRQTDSSLYLHAYVLSVTPPEKIGDEPRPKEEWEKKGVYFLMDEHWSQRILADVLK